MPQPTHLPAHHYTNMGPPATSPLTPSLDMHRHSNPTPTPEGINTTSDDSDDSTPHQTMVSPDFNSPPGELSLWLGGFGY